MRTTRIGIVAFATAAVMGPWYTVDGYSVVPNVISLLGAQNTANNFIMVAGFVALGVGIVVDGVNHFCRPVLPFIVFGLCMGLAGIFAHKPLSPEATFSEGIHQIHAALATLAGISITVGLFWQSVCRTSLRSKGILIALATLCFVMPLCMLAFPDVQGLIQRLMYLLIFTWLWVRYPMFEKMEKRSRLSMGS